MRMYQYDKDLDFHALGREIKRKREAKGWTQEYLAQLVDRTPRSIMYRKYGAFLFLSRKKMGGCTALSASFSDVLQAVQCSPRVIGASAGQRMPVQLTISSI